MTALRDRLLAAADSGDSDRGTSELLREAAAALASPPAGEAVAWRVRDLQRGVHGAGNCMLPGGGLNDISLRLLRESGREIEYAYSAPPSCTCPSGDGSLRWPCPQHHPAVAWRMRYRETDELPASTWTLCYVEPSPDPRFEIEPLVSIKPLLEPSP